MKLYKKDIPYADAGSLFSRFAGEPYALFLDSADRDHPDARYSFIAVRPAETIEYANRRVTITSPRQQTSFKADPFQIVEDRLKSYGLDEGEAGLPPFRGGAAGFFAYDTDGSPGMAIGIYDQALAFDSREKKAWILTQAENEDQAKVKRETLKAPSPALASARTPSLRREEGWGEGKIEWQSNFTKQSYEQAVRQVAEYIRAGDIFQANLSQRFETNLPVDFDAYEHYLLLRGINPAPFAGFMNLGGIKISSASPERFLTCDAKGRIHTKPIKGTAPRESDPEKLKASLKNRAENIMIVDLMRNDLSKVCEPASVEVEKLCEVESFARVHHLVSTISGNLRPKKSCVDLLRACFPGGSITGAPKIRAMEIIDELEKMPRGPYCGAMGYIGAGGYMDLNILIRTLVYQNGKVSFNAGGGITADSDPAQEYQETLDKAAAIFNSFSIREEKRKTA